MSANMFGGIINALGKLKKNINDQYYIFIYSVWIPERYLWKKVDFHFHKHPFHHFKVTMSISILCKRKVLD